MSNMDNTQPFELWERWFVDQFRRFQKSGFFASVRETSATSILQHPIFDDLIPDFRALAREGRWDPNDEANDFFMLSRDLDRVSSFDLEADDTEDGHLYEGLIGCIRDISRGHLQVTNVTEAWTEVDDRRYAVSIQLSSDGQLYSASERYSGGWAGVVNIFAVLDEILFKRGQRLWYVENVNQAVHMLVMSPEERRETERISRLRFGVA